MFRWLCGKSVFISMVAAGILASVWSTPAKGQIPSDADTMRILDTGALPGDTVIVDFFLRNTFVVGGYTFRLRYDTSLIEPLTDTVPFNDTYAFTVEVEALRGTSFENHGGAVRSPGEMVFSVVDLVHAPYSPDTTFYMPDRAVAVRLRWRVKPWATVQTTPIYFENDPQFPASWNTMTDISGYVLKRPVLVPGTFSILAPDCRWQGDANDNGVAYEVADLVFLIQYAFDMGPAPLKDPSCARVNRGDLTCDGVVDVMDLIAMLDVIYGIRQPGADGCM